MMSKAASRKAESSLVSSTGPFVLGLLVGGVAAVVLILFTCVLLLCPVNGQGEEEDRRWEGEDRGGQSERGGGVRCEVERKVEGEIESKLDLQNSFNLHNYSFRYGDFPIKSSFRSFGQRAGGGGREEEGGRERQSYYQLLTHI